MSLLPTADNPLYRLLNPGMPQGGGMGGAGGLFGRGPSWLGSGQGFGQQAQQQGLRGLLSDPNFGLALLANSGYSPNKRSFGEILGQSALQARQMGQQSEEADLMRKYREAQIGALQTPKTGNAPSSVQEYEYAKQNGFKGSFQDWIVAGGQSSRPSAVQEWEHFNKLSPQDQDKYLLMKRAQMQKVEELAGGKAVVSASPMGNVTTTGLTSLPQEAAAAETVKQAEGRGGAVGKTQGEITGGILTKGSNARSVLGMIDEADKIIDKATGSSGGALIDTAAATVGKSTEGAQAIARLKVLQAGLMLNMPRMEGPQSDRDVQLYREAAASLGEPDVPRETKKAALQTIRAIQERYKERAKQLSDAPANSSDPLGIRR
jgi:hypothetical protein